LLLRVRLSEGVIHIVILYYDGGMLLL